MRNPFLQPGGPGNLFVPHRGGSRQRMPDMLRGLKFKAVGSGVIIDAKKGYIVTNAHVIRDAKVITVTLSDGRMSRAKMIGKDSASDIAVLQIKADHLHAVPFSDSNKLAVGDFVATIGNPFGLHQTVTSGIVSALNRDDLGIEGYENFIQTDAPINPGNSGGALINLKGQLVGINTAIIGPVRGNVGIGFAIPSNMVKNVMDQLIKYGHVKRGMLGVMVENLSPDLADAFNVPGQKGALVTQVTPHSPAEKGGVKAEDIITKVNDNAVTNAAQIRTMVGLQRVGSTLDLTINRHGKTKNLSATLTDPKHIAQHSTKASPFLAGARLRDIDEMAPTGHHVVGVQVRQADITSNAWLGGLRPGDVIVAADKQPVKSITQLTAITKQFKHDHLLLKVWRNGVNLYMVLSTS